MAEKTFTLYDPNGVKYVAGSKTEAVRLVNAHGYTDKAPKAKSSEKS